jgi:UDP-hydrolysing UDP-N-acetyl-D-glucosamine 2-epimerase
MKIAAITGSRADCGPLGPVVMALDAQWLDIEPAVPGATRYDAAIAASLVIQDTTRQLAYIRPDLVLLLGDRYEILAAATAAYLMGCPIAHLSGGDVTEGSADEGMRHAISKLAHLHFATNAASAARLRAMGENPARVHVVGCPGIDRLRTTKLMAEEDARARVGLVGFARHLLVCYHPNTVEPGETKNELAAITGALERVPADIGIVIIGPNHDPGSADVRFTLRKFAHRANAVYHDHLENQAYLTLMATAAAMVGNSSAGLYEAPYFGASVINLGDRQQGRYQAACVVNMPFNADMIYGCILNTCAAKYIRESDHYYGDGHAAERIAAVIAAIKDPRALLRKKWHDAWPTTGYGTEFTQLRNGADTLMKGWSPGPADLVANLDVP